MDYISFEDFQRIDLRLAKIKSAQKVEGSEKLLKLILEVGEEERTVVAGISKYYSPEELEGKKVIMVYNLKPRKIMGIESQGMVLALYDGENLSLIVPDREGIKAGTRVS